MKKKDSSLPEGFSSEPEKVTPVAVASETTVPSIEKDAELKIDSVVPIVPEIPPSEKKDKFLFILGSIVGVLVIISTIVLGVIFFRRPAEQQMAVTPTPTATPTVSNTPTPVPLRKSEITFDVLNSTDTKGLAAKYGKTLESMGYTVNKLGNSPDTVKGIPVYLSKEIESKKEIVMSDLIKSFPEATYAGVLTGSSSQARLIIGTTK